MMNYALYGFRPCTMKRHGKVMGWLLDIIG